MLDFELSEQTRQKLVPYHREFQAAIAVIAHRLLGEEITEAHGAGLYQGGVKIRDADICIGRNIVQTYWPRQLRIEEEGAVVAAIKKIAADFEIRGEVALEPYRDMAKKVGHDPLRVMLDL